MCQAYQASLERIKIAGDRVDELSFLKGSFPPLFRRPFRRFRLIAAPGQKALDGDVLLKLVPMDTARAEEELVAQVGVPHAAGTGTGPAERGACRRLPVPPTSGPRRTGRSWVQAKNSFQASTPTLPLKGRSLQRAPTPPRSPPA